MWIAHTEEVRLFREVTGVEQALVQQIVGTVEEAYLAYIRNRTTNSINDTVVGVLMHLKDNYYCKYVLVVLSIITCSMMSSFFLANDLSG